MATTGIQYLIAALGGWLLALGLEVVLRESGPGSARVRLGGLRVPAWLVLGAGIALLGFGFLPGPAAPEAWAVFGSASVP